MNRTAKQTRDDIAGLLKARNTLLWIVTREELRVERSIIEAAASAQYDTWLWDCATGLTDAAGVELDAGLRDPAAILNRIKADTARRVYILRDLHRWFDPVILRTLRSLARNLQTAPRSEARAIVLLTPSSEVPPDLSGSATVIDYPIPTREEIAAILTSVIDALPDEIKATVAENGSREKAIDAAIGLTADEASNCYAKSLVTARKIDPAIIAAEKQRVIAREKVLTWYDPDPRGLDAIGGLENLKAWLTERKLAFTKQARDYGLPSPKGCLLVGVPGCGKSLTAKAIAAAWQLPLLRLDLGALRSKYVGESEGNIRRALSVAETIAPCVLWLDEIEKALAGATGPAGDGGVAADALGAVLGWMQERTAGVFVVATSNDVSALPPELLRKGRFDELFFVDLPTRVERAAIIRTTLRQFGRNPDTIDGSALAEVTEGFSGAEIAALVPDAMFQAFAEGAREINIRDLVIAASCVVPLSTTAKERIDKMKEWAKGRARPASIPQKMATTTGMRTVDIEV